MQAHFLAIALCIFASTTATSQMSCVPGDSCSTPTMSEQGGALMQSKVHRHNEQTQENSGKNEKVFDAVDLFTIDAADLLAFEDGDDDDSHTESGNTTDPDGKGDSPPGGGAGDDASDGDDDAMVKKMKSGSDEDEMSIIKAYLCAYQNGYTPTCACEDKEVIKAVEEDVACRKTCLSHSTAADYQQCKAEKKCWEKAAPFVNKWWASLPANRKFQFKGCYRNRCLWGVCKWPKPAVSKNERKWLKKCSRKCEVDTCAEEEVQAKALAPIAATRSAHENCTTESYGCDKEYKAKSDAFRYKKMKKTLKNALKAAKVCRKDRCPDECTGRAHMSKERCAKDCTWSTCPPKDIAQKYLDYRSCWSDCWKKNLKKSAYKTCFTENKCTDKWKAFVGAWHSTDQEVKFTESKEYKECREKCVGETCKDPIAKEKYSTRRRRAAV
eukprot:gnl/TRDRNA2_/TRDRNA2_176178_c0_seq1.p1 gnl/TRDRNA2_/TRDRNA2_176178_c0~~gnl/TRDRNA2_/TRDRNA2_176178_c0_seq1.p1  ORF type:complete len:440 (-),score=103.83 gnl/TRDRNA2_/TRDRNA2_176178_c0_seq1:34-1353(-)